MIMKELSTEQKAKAYDEALEVAQRFYNNSVAITKKGLEDIFPKLKESEDEKIRKFLIQMAQNGHGGNKDWWNKCITWLEKQGQIKDSLISQRENKTCKESDDSLTSEDERIRKEIIYFLSRNTLQFGEDVDKYKSWIAWLEKQGKQKNKINLCKITFEDVLALECSMKTAKITKGGDELYKILVSLYNKIHNAYLAEKQGEQKPADKVEPKFKVGDWITNGHATCQITFIDSRYWYSETCVLGNVIDIDKTFHLWNITKDAKPGDVLVTDSGRPFIFKGCTDKNFPNSPVAYCGIDTRDKFYAYNSNDWWTNKNVYPATKKQRDLLFQKMTESGYEWNTEKKELKKIEQNPAWSEEDDSILNELTKYFESLLGCIATEERHKENRRWLNWLKSLKDRYTWKPSDEQLVYLSAAVEESNENPVLDSLYKDLLKLKG